MPKVEVQPFPREIPQEEKRGPGRPKSVIGTTTAGLE
jgi:hypothetical protein